MVVDTLRETNKRLTGRTEPGLRPGIRPIVNQLLRTEPDRLMLPNWTGPSCLLDQTGPMFYTVKAASDRSIFLFWNQIETIIFALKTGLKNGPNFR